MLALEWGRASLTGRIGMDKEQDVTELLDAIIWGRRIVSVDNRAGERQVFVFRPLTLEERNMGNYLYAKSDQPKFTDESNWQEEFELD